MLMFKSQNKEKNAFTASEEAFQMDIRVQNMVRIHWLIYEAMTSLLRRLICPSF